MNTDKCTKLSPADPDLKASFLYHSSGFVENENALKQGISNNLYLQNSIYFS